MSGSTIERLRPTLTLPDGRVVRGRWPQDLPDRGEWPYIRHLAKNQRGICEAVLPGNLGRVDVLASSGAFEVESAKKWRTGARQAMSYSAMTGLPPHIALFGEGDYFRIFMTIRDRINRQRGHEHHLTLWRWAGDLEQGYFVRIGSRVSAMRKTWP